MTRLVTIGSLCCCATIGTVSDCMADDIPPKLAELVELLVVQAVKGWGEVDRTAPMTIDNAECFRGATIFASGGFRYELFPSLGFYRVEPLLEDKGWLFMSLNPQDAKSAVKSAADGSPLLDPKLMDRIRSCGSGLVSVDLSGAQVTCSRTSEYRVLASTVRQNDGKASVVHVLVTQDDTILAVGIGDKWEDPEQLGSEIDRPHREDQ